ncbi:MAG: SprT family zinc-dependent metalloprotease [Nitrospiraceae bacterium]|nr:SprT family zinc-dependent metalloprotease [Nitrospiraceae bacterium]
MPVAKNAQADQLSLNFPAPEAHVVQTLREMIAKPTEVVITDNTSSMLSYREKNGRVMLRMHRMFLAADLPVLAEVAAFVRNRQTATPLMRSFIRAGEHLIRQKSSGRTMLVSKGRYHDLAELFAEINEQYFNGRIASAITWSSREPKYGVRRRNLGSYDHRRDLIRISRYLDRRAVPRYFVAYVVYHEMLHADLGVRRKNGRSVVHCREFRDREKRYQDFERALAWERGGH